MYIGEPRLLRAYTWVTSLRPGYCIGERHVRRGRGYPAATDGLYETGDADHSDQHPPSHTCRVSLLPPPAAADAVASPVDSAAAAPATVTSDQSVS